MTKVLHITPHFGGGIGTVLNGYLCSPGSRKHNHIVACLGTTRSPHTRSKFPFDIQLHEEMRLAPDIMSELIQESDIVLLHWWNHPLMFEFLVGGTWPACRVIIWSHVSCLHPPDVVTSDLLNYADRFIWTSPISNHVMQQMGQPNAKTIWSTGGLNAVSEIKAKPHDGIIVGYHGTTSYSKMHGQFLQMCSMVIQRENKIRFVVCSGPDHDLMKNQAEAMGISDRVCFIGPQADIRQYLSEVDIFGYPLSDDHFGTCEQALGEAMAAGIPPVVLDHPAERYIVRNEIDGIIAADPGDYVNGLIRLANDCDLRRTMGRAASQRALELYSVEKYIADWDNVFAETLELPKRVKAWPRHSKQPCVYFAESLGAHGEIFHEYIKSNPPTRHLLMDEIRKLFDSSEVWHGTSKGSSGCYASHFPEDENLRLWFIRPK